MSSFALIGHCVRLFLGWEQWLHGRSETDLNILILSSHLYDSIWGDEYLSFEFANLLE